MQTQAVTIVFYCPLPNDIKLYKNTVAYGLTNGTVTKRNSNARTDDDTS